MYFGAVFSVLLAGLVIALTVALIAALIRKPGWGLGIVGVGALALCVLFLGTRHVSQNFVPPPSPDSPGIPPFDEPPVAVLPGGAAAETDFKVSLGEPEWDDGQIKLVMAVSRTADMTYAVAGASASHAVATASEESDDVLIRRELPELKRAALARAPEALERSLEELTESWSDLTPEWVEARRDFRALRPRDRLRVAQIVVGRADAGGDVNVEAAAEVHGDRRGNRKRLVRIEIPPENLAAVIRDFRHRDRTRTRSNVAPPAIAALAIVAGAYVVLRISTRRARLRCTRPR